MEIDIESILQSEEIEELKELKLFLFKESIRLKNEQRELTEEQDRLAKQKTQFRSEVDMVKNRIGLEQKRLKDDNLFFEKKMQILQDGFKQLDLDRSRFEKERSRFLLEKELWDGEQVVAGKEDVAAVLFRGVNNPLALRKRYKDLLKIFHPDNLAGDVELVQLINREYERRKKAE